MHRMSLAALSKALRTKQISSSELTRLFLDRIGRYDQRLNSFITVTEEIALAQAAAADRLIASGEAKVLTGIPIAHKDLFCTRGVRTSCGSRMLDNFVSPYDATIVKKLSDEATVMLGKTNMDEFAMGSSNENSFYGPVHNPWNTAHVPGGSSGGSAAAVAAALVPIATGTDTGGSVRQPAALCGLTGLKPTYGRVSRYGMVAFASSLDQAGVIARSGEDIALVLSAMAGFDEKDSTSTTHPVDNYANLLSRDLKGLTAGVPEQYFSDGVDSRITTQVHTAMAVLQKAGVKLRPVTLPTTDLAVATYYVVAPAECSSNLSRYDGVRFGYRADQPKDLEDLYVRSRTEGFGAEVKRRIMIGTYVLSAGYYDAYYLKAQKIRRLISEDFKRVFTEVDVIVGPTTPEVAFPLGAKSADPITMYMSDVFTTAVNLAGLPAISIPVGFCDGLPVGMQIIGNYFAEGLLLGLTQGYQQSTDWHEHFPPEFD